jgi:adenylate cyclase
MASARTRIRLRQLAVITLVAWAVTPVFNVMTSEATPIQVLYGVVDATIISGLVGGYLFFIRDGLLRFWFRRIGFFADLVLSSTIMLILFLVGRAVGQVAVRLDPGRFLASFSDAHLAYALPFFAVLAFTIQFLLQMNRMVGANVLGYFATGAYHRPKAEERVFLFLDLEGSTKLAERLGSARYFDLLRRIVDELTEPVLAAQGEIYQYAGDEVVITWPMATGVRDANCVRCYFGIRAALAQQAAGYQRDFGAVPRLRGGLHGGMVTAGELGDLRQQIVFVGDILNTAARLEEYAKRSGLDLVVSGTMLSRLRLPPDLRADPCGELELRGKEARVAAYRLSVDAIDSANAATA